MGPPASFSGAPVPPRPSFGVPVAMECGVGTRLPVGCRLPVWTAVERSGLLVEPVRADGEDRAGGIQQDPLDRAAQDELPHH